MKEYEHCNLLAPANHCAKKDCATPFRKRSSRPRRIRLKVENDGIVRCLDDNKERPEWVSKVSYREGIIPHELPKFSQKAAKEYVKGLGKPLNFMNRIPSKHHIQRVTSRNNRNRSNKSNTSNIENVKREFGENDVIRASNGKFDDISTIDKKLITSASSYIEPNKRIEERKATNKSSIDNMKYPCNCGKDNKLPCCKRAANWIKIAYHDQYHSEQYKKAYYVLL